MPTWWCCCTRDDDRETPRNGEAHFVVPKHRNGLTDTIVVAFQGRCVVRGHGVGDRGRRGLVGRLS